jgi:hypothetical protein
MVEGLREKVSDAVVRQGIVDMLALSRARDEPRAGELLESLRY